MKFHPTRAPEGRIVSVGVVANPRLDADRFLEVAKAAEAQGADSVWAFDHLLPFTPNGQLLECWTALTLAGAMTTRVRIGPQVLCQSFRPPGLLAKMATTLDSAIAGRLEVAVGAGWHEPEYQAFGYPFPDARTRFAETVEYMEILRPALAGEVTTFRGEHYWVDGLRCAPPSPQPGGPPLTLGGAGRRMLELGARLADNINLPAAAVQGDVEHWAKRVDAACEAVGRDRSTLGLTLQVPSSIGRTREEAEALLAADPRVGFAGPPQKVGLFGSVTDCRELLGRWVAAGVDEVQCILPVTPELDDSLARLMDAACA